ncbi:hypothetical protein [Hymenobacter terricola]|uniref:hypothetical protein n=1 Tax=Hymenobacter terricola TaxID=2819236 RepID=UPI001B307B83|nr:hypothetical protein [Hymenobacter terricola]
MMAEPGGMWGAVGGLAREGVAGQGRNGGDALRGGGGELVVEAVAGGIVVEAVVGVKVGAAAVGHPQLQGQARAQLVAGGELHRHPEAGIALPPAAQALEKAAVGTEAHVELGGSHRGGIGGLGEAPEGRREEQQAEG